MAPWGYSRFSWADDWPGPRVKALRGVGKESFYAMIARVREAIIVRVPLGTEAR